jgi:putative OPT family oligopeptide transporter
LYQTAAATFKSFSTGSNGQASLDRTDRDMPMKYVILGALVLIVIIALDPFVKVGILGALAIAVFGFLFVTVASRIVGIVGSSSSPVSGMTIATLLIVTLIFKLTGYHGKEGMVAALTVAAIVCTALAVAGDISQDLKTGYLVGGTPWKQQVAMMIGVLASGLVMGFILVMLNKAYTMGSAALPAPKAMLMKILVEGIMGGNLPWELILIGASISIVIEFLGLNSLVVAVGLYLPVHTSVPIMAGGIVRWLVEVFSESKEEKEKRSEKGILFASGLIAGESLVGVIIAILIWLKVPVPENVATESQWLPLLLFIIFCIMLYMASSSKKGLDKK